MVLLSSKSPKLKHVVCHRRQVYMVLKDVDSHLNLSLTFIVEGLITSFSDTMKCFGCKSEGHFIRACPEARTDDTDASGSGGSVVNSAVGADGAVACPRGRNRRRSRR